jgi:hypothetical protein
MKKQNKTKKHVHYFKLIGGVVAGDLPEESEDKLGDKAHCIAR